jgi:hypothetical protein
MRDNETGRHYLPRRLLRILAARLNERGMQTREFRHGDEIIEIAATNPRDPDKGGRVVVGCEGYLVWECWTEFKTDSDAITAADIIHVLLTEDLAGRHPAIETQAPAAETPARAAVDTTRAGPHSRAGPGDNPPRTRSL